MIFIIWIRTNTSDGPCDLFIFLTDSIVTGVITLQDGAPQL